MVIVKLFGGLGNQMFQYACGRALALRLKTNLGADLSWFDSQKILDTERSYKLDAFRVVLRKLNNQELQPFRFQWLLLKFGLNRKDYFKERSFDFNSKVIKQKDGVFLEGYWQSEKYFLDFKETIKNDFSLRFPLSREAADIHEMINKVSCSCALHVRRGDYVLNPAINGYHGVCSFDYYKNAVDYIRSRVGEPIFFVFSDDIEWAKSNLNFGKTVFVNIGDQDGLKDQEELILMSKCQHQIIANSTFSWWAAWLNENSEKIVVAPDKWFNIGIINTKDLLPSSWIKIKRDRE